MIGEFFDPKAELLIHDRLRPHWSQSGAIVFVTMRTHDSIPREVLLRWEAEKKDWLQRNQLFTGKHWSETLTALTSQQRNAFKKEFNRCREDFLDTCHGACFLKNPELASLVAESLMHFDGVRYRMGDFIVMPNHVHLLAAFPDAITMEKQFDSWMHYTATQINRETGKKGRFWQQEPFDHLVRSPEQYDYLRWYIKMNPERASLRAGEFFYRRYSARDET